MVEGEGVWRSGRRRIGGRSEGARQLTGRLQAEGYQKTYRQPPGHREGLRSGPWSASACPAPCQAPSPSFASMRTRDGYPWAADQTLGEGERLLALREPPPAAAAAAPQRTKQCSDRQANSVQASSDALLGSRGPRARRWCPDAPPSLSSTFSARPSAALAVPAVPTSTSLAARAGLSPRPSTGLAGSRRKQCPDDALENACPCPLLLRPRALLPSALARPEVHDVMSPCTLVQPPPPPPSPPPPAPSAHLRPTCALRGA